jgi:hypothetical protein
MARLDEPADALALVVTAHLEQGIVMDNYFGLALDGILASQVRKDTSHSLQLGRSGGSDLDGGLSGTNPVDWPLPLARCVPEEKPDDWHWACSIAVACDQSGDVLIPLPPDPHRLSVRLDARRAYQVAVRVPTTAGGSSGRFRTRITPVLSVIAHQVKWVAVGIPTEIERLLASVPAIGGRRGSGEGAVRKWDFTPVDTADTWMFAHRFEEGRLTRPMPVVCAETAGLPDARVGQAGIRPPLIHPKRQRALAIPNITSS